ncbi:MAG: HEAT repeat domain-containing protein [Desulfobacteraceae bacterium]|nr:HEAT repeat domain-containing protein [Desulfobacteraceae bacterium]
MTCWRCNGQGERLGKTGFCHFLIVAVALGVMVTVFQGCGTMKSVLHREVDTVAPVEGNSEKPFEDLDSFDPKIRMEAAESLGHCTPVKTRQMTIYAESLGRSAGSESQKIMDSMADLSESLAHTVDVLCNASRDFDPKVRVAAVKSLGLIANELGKALKPLEQMIADAGKDDDQPVSQTAKKTRAIVQKRIDQISEDIVQSTSDSESKVKKIAADYLRDIRSTKNASILVEAKTRKEVDHEEPVAAPSVDISKTDVPKADTDTPKTDESKADTPMTDVPKPEEVNNAQPAFPELKKLVTKLDSFDLGTRRFAVTALGAFIEKETAFLPDKIASVKNGDIAVRIKAADDINDFVLKMEKMVNVLCHSMQDIDSDIRVSAAKDIGDILSPISASLENLDEAPRDIEDTMKREKVKADSTVQMQINQFKSTANDTVEKVLALLGKGLPVLFNAIDDKVYSVRVASGGSLRKIVANSENMTPIAPVWTRALKPLGLSPKEITVRLLTNELGNDSVDVARKSARDLSEMGSDAKSAIPALIRVITDNNNPNVHYKYVKIEAMAALGNMGADAAKAVPALISQLDDIQFEERAMAVKALGQIGSKDAVIRIVDLLDSDSSSPVREAAAAALANMDPSDWLDKVYLSLFNAIKDSSGPIRLNAFKTLAVYETKNMGEGIIKWKSSDKSIQGYKVCYTAPNKNDDCCIDTGLVSAIRLSDMKNHGKGLEGIRVQSYQESGVRDVDIKFIDIKALLQKSMEVETEKGIRTEKEKAMLKMIETI